MKDTMENNRSEERISTEVLGDFKRSDSEQWNKGLFVDVSRGGGCMLVSEQIDPSTPLDLKIQVGQIFVAGTASVRWSRPVRGERVWATGFAFENADQSELKHFIQYAGSLLQ